MRLSTSRPAAPRLIATLAGLTLAGGALVACGGDEETTGADEPTVTAIPTPVPETETPEAGETPEGSGRPRIVETVATGLEAPWGIGFLPDGSALVTERDSGRVMAVAPGEEPREVGEISETESSGSEAGLLGLAVSPAFDSDQTVFLYVTTAEDNRVVRATYDGQRLGGTEVVLDGIPSDSNHNGGRMIFGPDGHLYVSTGEIYQAELAQDRDSLAGKILRIDTDGNPAPDNPDPASPVYSLGHRNVQGLAFDAEGRLWASEFGANAFDELNLIEAGGNYGWPEVEGRGGPDEYVEPQQVWSTDEASPSGLAFTDGHLWLAALQGERLWRVDVADGETGNPRDFFVGKHGRMRTVEVAPDGNLWVSTSNRDGRGDPGPEDDRILVVDPNG